MINQSDFEATKKALEMCENPELVCELIEAFSDDLLHLHAEDRNFILDVFTGMSEKVEESHLQIVKLFRMRPHYDADSWLKTVFRIDTDRKFSVVFDTIGSDRLKETGKLNIVPFEGEAKQISYSQTIPENSYIDHHIDFDQSTVDFVSSLILEVGRLEC